MRKKGDWKVQKGLLRVPWFGRHVEKLGDVIIYPVLVGPGLLTAYIILFYI